MSTAAFFAAIRPLFAGALSQSQVDGINHILAATEGLPKSYRAYLLATTHHETAKTMMPVRETLARTDKSAVARLESAWAKGRLKSVKTPYWRFDKDGKTWLGRGYVQLTHKANYERAGKLIGVDLVGNPNAAMIPQIAAKVLVQGSVAGIFTGKKLGDYLPGDYVNARRVINGTDQAEMIAGLARAYEAALNHFDYAQPTKPATPRPTTVNPLAAFFALLARFLGGKK